MVNLFRAAKMQNVYFVFQFDLICGDKYLNTVSTSMYYVSFLIGSIVFGNFAGA